MFLINSRTPFVIATCNLHCRHPLYQRYRAIVAEFPKYSYSLRRLGLLSQGHFSRFLVRSHKILATSIFTDSGPWVRIAPVPNFNPLLVITTLRGFILVKLRDSVTNPSLKCLKVTYRCRKRICVAREYERVSLSVKPDYG